MRKSYAFFLALCGLALAGSAAAGTLSPGLENQIRDLDDSDLIKVLVVLQDQADIASLDWELHDAKATLALRHQLVLETLQDKAARTQAPLLAELAGKAASGEVLGYTPHWLINAVVVKATVGAVRDLAGRPDVEVIEADLVVELIEPIPPSDPKLIDRARSPTGIGITPGVVAVGARRVWTELGIRGTGAIVGILDTGVDGNHPALSSRWRGNFAPASECWFDAADFGDPTPQDHHYHGTHVMGTICGLAPDDTIGVAPEALWIASNVINQGVSSEFDSDVIASLEFMADPDGDPFTTDDVPDVVQNSWGINENFSGNPPYVDCDSRWWTAMDNCEASGVVLTWSAGNEGPGGSSLRSPADRANSPTNAFSVGSTIAYPPYTISSFSSRGPSGCGGAYAMKPEVSAPGSDIYSAEPGGGYQYLSGTSMAGPHVAGVVALMRSANPNVDVITIKETLMSTAEDLGTIGEDNTYGHGFIDAYEAVLLVMGGIGQAQGTVTDAGTSWPIDFAYVRDVGGYASQQTDQNGFYSMTLTAEEHTLEYSAFGYYTETRVVTVPEDGVVVTDVALNQAPQTRVYGYVFGPDSELLPGATVIALGTPVSPATTNGNGYYELFLPDGGTYELRAQGPGTGWDQHTVVLDAEKQQNFLLPALMFEDFETADFSSYPWQLGGNANWFVDTTAPYEGAYSARSGDINDSQESVLAVTLEVGGGEISFFRRVSSEGGYDYLRFLIDGAEQASWSGELGWAQASFAVAPGSHTFTWKYTKDSSVSNGSACAWIDLVIFPGVEDVPQPALALDFATVDFSIMPGDVREQGKFIRNVGEASLTWRIDLAPAERTAARPPVVPDLELAKGEADPRPGHLPITGQGGPDTFGYSWIDSDEIGGPTYNWIEINSIGTVVGGGDDVNYGPYNLGFSFPYYDLDFTQVRVCTNGWLSFTSTTNSYTNQGIPNTGDPNNLLAPFWDDLNPNSGGTIYYYQDVANQQFIVEWDGVHHYYSGNPETFQAIIRANGSIVFQYKIVALGNGCTVGIENATGTDGLQVAFNAAYLHSNLAIQFSAVPPVPWLSVAPETGSLPAGHGQLFHLTYDATELGLGTYQANMVITTNDPLNSAVVIPVTLTVAADLTDVGDGDLPDVFALRPAHPNPFNPMTEIEFSLPGTAHVDLRIYDVAGRLVRTLVSETRSGGSHSLVWNGTDSSGRSVASGTYYARLSSAGQHQVQSLVLVR